jgi:tRNA(Arg) A34 adenosine deaminase TadA
MKSEQAILPEDIDYLCRAIALGAEAEAEGNLPIGAIVVMEGRVIAEARNKVLFPEFHPGRHAEIEAMNMIRGEWLLHEAPVALNVGAMRLCGSVRGRGPELCGRR